MIFGIQCKGTNCPGNSPTASAAALGAQAFLTRLPVVVPFFSQTDGTVFYVTADVLVGDIEIFVPDITGVQVGDLFYGPAWADGVFATVVSKGELPSPKIVFDTPIQNYIHNAVAALAQVAELQAAAIPYCAMLFNLDGPSTVGSGPILTSPATWRNQVVLTVQQMMLTGPGPILMGCENEEDGGNKTSNPGPPPVHNGDSSTLSQYLEKLGIVVDVAEQFGIPSMDGGTTANGLQTATWFYLFYTLGTTFSRAQADAFVSTTFSKNPTQFNFANALPTSANPLGPNGNALFMASIDDDVMTVIEVLAGAIQTGPSATLFGPGVALGTFQPPMNQYVVAQIDGVHAGAGHYQISIPQNLPITLMSTNSITMGRLNRAQKVTQLISSYARMGTTNYNAHWYEVLPVSMRLIMEFINGFGFKPLVAGEMGIYSTSLFDVVAMLSGAQWLQCPYIFWWNDVSTDAENGGNVALQNVDGTLRNSGTAWQSFAATRQPPLMGQPGVPLAINPQQVSA